MKIPKLNREKQLETILTLCVVLVAIYLFTAAHHKAWLITGFVLGLIGMFSTFLTEKISQGWMFLGEAMGAVMSKVILSIVFFVFLFPIAMAARLFRSGKDSLQLKKPVGDSYYFVRNHKYEAKDLKNSW